MLQKKLRKESVEKQRADGRKFEVKRPFEKIRSDNGSQFISKKLAEFLDKRGVFNSFFELESVMKRDLL